MKKRKINKIYPIFLEKYNKKWPSLFKKEKNVLKNIFQQDLKIEHIGSTAIKGLSAKPTIDVLLELPQGLSKKQMINIMEDNGYIHMKKQKKHLMFVKGYTPKGLAKESYHIHVGPLTQNWLWDRVCFRDYLNDNPDEANNYENLKEKLTQKHKNDREAYTDGKAKYIKKITEKAKKKER